MFSKNNEQAVTTKGTAAMQHVVRIQITEWLQKKSGHDIYYINRTKVIMWKVSYESKTGIFETLDII